MLDWLFVAGRLFEPREPKLGPEHCLTEMPKRL